MLKDNGRGIILDHPVEPLYGDLYLPRKFKIGVTVPGDNSIDIYTNDIGLVAITDPSTGELEGFNVAVGGGLGRTHNKDTTFARAADHLGFVPKDRILEACKAILAAQRDHGNREVRANARMKYLVHTLGVDRFRTLIESYMGSPMAPWREMQPWKYSDWMGWHEQGEGLWFYGFNIEQGRVIDVPGGPQIKTALRTIVDKYGYPMVCTPNQSLIFKDVPAAQRGEVEALLLQHGILPIEAIDPLTRLSMACPALPMCGLAITEAERRMPSFILRVRSLLDSVGLGDEEIMMRMTGCPNGCARPYMAELAFVGDGPDSYQLWLGGTPSCDRVGYPLMDRMKEAALESTLKPILEAYKAGRQTPAGGSGPESFGEFCARLGKAGVEAAIA
jgi:sulfite reductase (ferredoxin)